MHLSSRSTTKVRLDRYIDNTYIYNKGPKLKGHEHLAGIALRPAGAVYLTPHHIYWSMIQRVSIRAKIHASLLHKGQAFLPSIP